MAKKPNKRVIIRRTQNINMIRRLHSICFPDDEFYGTCDAVWWVGYCNGRPVCFAGIDPDYRVKEAFLCRAGVIPEFRGQGLQKRMIKARERFAIQENIKNIWTYVSPMGAASLNSLYRLGYKSFVPHHEQFRVDGFVHMIKVLK